MELFCVTAATPSGLLLPVSRRHRSHNPAASFLPSYAQASFRERRNSYCSHTGPGARFFDLRLLTAAATEDTSSKPLISTKEEDSGPSVGATVGFSSFETPMGEKEEALKEEQEASDNSTVIEYEEIARESDPNDALQFLNNLNVELDSGDAYSILLYGTSAFAALWVSSAIVSALDSIPVIPKLLEIIGLGYSVWFSYRYLIFKKNRDELFDKVEDLKEQILGPSD